MFLFKCCQSVQTGRGYTVKKKNKNNEQVVTYINSLNDVDRKQLRDPTIQILKVEKSQYDDLIKEYKGTEKKWTDPNFPPNQQSLGVIQNVQTSQWKRISDILNKPALFDGKIEPKDVIQGSLGDCYFLSALAALAEKQQRIKTIFGDQTFSPNGIYKVTLRIDGIIQEILIDDFIPVNKKGQPLFCQPNRNQFWVLILEKAWAKAHGSYANIVSGNPTEVFKAVTYAPAEMHLVKETEEEREKLWKIILQHAIKDHPCCCGTDDRPDIDWERIKLVSGHAYTLIHAAILEHNNGKEYKMLILRNPWGETEWQGQGCERDEQFWENIKPTQQKNFFMNRFQKANDGIFFITYTDFCRFFSQTHFCMLQEQGNYISEDLYPNRKNGSVFTFEVQTKGQYVFQLHQEGIRGEDEQKIEDGLCRSTLLVARKQQSDYKFIDGVLKYNDEDTTLNTHLEPGNYVLYAKLDPTRKNSYVPNKTSVSVYSRQFTDIEPSDQKHHPNLLKKMFLDHAKLHKRQTYNNQQMWISWKLLFQQGGYAYIALGNSSDSKKKFIVTFNQEEFNGMNFILKKSFKGKGNGQTVIVEPGQEEIILARVKNVSIKSLKFPPQLGIKMQKLDGKE